MLHDLLAAEDAIRVAGEEIQEPELGRRQRDLLVVDAHAVPDRVELEVASEGIGRGTTVTLTLPLGAKLVGR